MCRREIRALPQGTRVKQKTGRGGLGRWRGGCAGGGGEGRALLREPNKKMAGGGGRGGDK